MQSYRHFAITIITNKFFHSRTRVGDDIEHIYMRSDRLGAHHQKLHGTASFTTIPGKDTKALVKRCQTHRTLKLNVLKMARSQF